MVLPSLADRIDDALPQTQCTRCGHAGCRPYAEAIALGRADINRCPPGGDALVLRLAALTGRTARPLDASCGDHGPRLLAVIDENSCIGCRLCIDACPVDAIIGAPRRLHVVLPSLCSGCELCVPPCPVDCISIVAAGCAWTDDDAAAARARHRDRETRLARNERVASRSSAPPADASTEAAQRQARVGAAIDRARARRAARAA